MNRRQVARHSTFLPRRDSRPFIHFFLRRCIPAPTTGVGLWRYATDGINFPVSFPYNWSTHARHSWCAISHSEHRCLEMLSVWMVCDFHRIPFCHLRPVGKAPSKLCDLCGGRVNSLRCAVTLAFPFVGILVFRHSVVRRQQSQQPR